MYIILTLFYLYLGFQVVYFVLLSYFKFLGNEKNKQKYAEILIYSKFVFYFKV
jgi:hypothetical protein